MVLSYEYSDYEGESINFDSYMVPTTELSKANFVF